MGIINEIKNIRSGRKELREFGVILAVFFCLIAVLGLKHHGSVSMVYLYVASFFVLSGLIVPVILLPFQKIWMVFAVLMGWVMSRVILCVIYYIFITPLGLVMRLFKRDMFGIEVRSKKHDTYWIKREEILFDKHKYERQF